jgi:hypothetical protein
VRKQRFSPKRIPAEETLGPYPGLVVQDNRVGGQITIGRSRVPAWVMLGESFGASTPFVDWATIKAQYNFGPEQLEQFLEYLLQAPGELARLLLTLAEAEQRWRLGLLLPYLEAARNQARERGEQSDAGLAIDPLTWPRPWWEHEAFRRPVVEQLERCLERLGGRSRRPLLRHLRLEFRFHREART